MCGMPRDGQRDQKGQIHVNDGISVVAVGERCMSVARKERNRAIKRMDDVPVGVPGTLWVVAASFCRDIRKISPRFSAAIVLAG